MAYLVGKGNAVSVLHVCRDLNGDPLTGQAASITTALVDNAGASSALTVTVTEIGSTGYYTLAVTPTATGNWLLSATNPAVPTADGQTTSYTLDVQAAPAVAASAAKNLTTRARVKERLTIATATTTFDDLIDNLIAEVSNDLQDRMGRCIGEDTYTEYHDGSGTDILRLRQGPLVSITSVEEVTYGGTTSRTETLTTVQEADYLEHGLRSEGWTMRAGIRAMAGVWTRGRRNYKVVYVGGWSTVPETMVKAATDWVVAAFETRETTGLAAKIQGDATVDAISMDEANAAIDKAIAPYTFYSEAA